MLDHLNRNATSNTHHLTSLRYLSNEQFEILGGISAFEWMQLMNVKVA